MCGGMLKVRAIIQRASVLTSRLTNINTNKRSLSNRNLSNQLIAHSRVGHKSLSFFFHNPRSCHSREHL